MLKQIEIYFKRMHLRKVKNTIINRRVNSPFMTTKTMNKFLKPISRSHQITNTKRKTTNINLNKLTRMQAIHLKNHHQRLKNQ